MKKLLALLLAAVMVLALVACTNSGDDTTEPSGTGTPSTPDATNPDPSTPDGTDPQPTDPVATYVPSGNQLVANLTYGEDGDYISLYEKYGETATIADVWEDENGLAWATFEDVDYELGMDFLSMAMVYNTTELGSFANEDEVYAEWWKYYITRWNYLMPEVPLYSNEYYDVYNAQIGGVVEHPTNPFWSPASALIEWTSSKPDNDIIIGSSTDLSGKFRFATFGGNSPGSSDLEVQNLTHELGTVVSTKEGSYVNNETVVKSIDYVDNADGSGTFTITLHEDLKFSDGSAVTAKNYLYYVMVFSSPVATEAAGKNHESAMSIQGYDAYSLYDGTNDGVDGASKVLSGLRLLGDYQFSVTIADDFLPYFYDNTYAGFSATYKDLWLGEFDIKDDGNGVYIEDGFYAKDGDSYVMAAHIKESAWNTDTTYPYSGPYMVTSYDKADKSAVLEINPYYKGNYEGAKPSIAKIVYKKIVQDTQLDDFVAGGLDVLANVTGGDQTNEAIKLADESDGKYVYTHYSRAGYGKLGFRCDYGPTQFTEVRRAIAYCMDRATFAKDFTGGYGGVVDGPYYTGSWMYKAATAQGMLVNAYDTSVDQAIALLEEGGWIYNADGTEYAGTGVRYKKIPAEYASENDINYKSIDGAYYTTEVNGDYYMPLCLNWFSTVENEFSDMLVTGFAQADNIVAAGFVVYQNTGDFYPMLDEFYQQAVYGYYAGTPMYNCFNYATGFNSALYDYAWYMTVDPGMYDNYSQYYLKDTADIYLINNNNN